MLANLKIENVAVIEKAEVNFTHGFTVLTGETGAGKSILIDSINAILGNRTSRELVRSGAQKACIWATFEAIPASVKKQLEKCGYEASDDLLLYREINAEGKGSCRINGMPATAAVVRDISAGLLSIHGQHDSQSLTNPALHLDLLDQYAQNRELFAEYYRRYRELVTVKRQLDTANASEADKQRRIEALTAEIDAIDAAALQPGEEKTLQERKTVITHAQSILEGITAAHLALAGDEDGEQAGAADLLGGAVDGLQNSARLDESLAAMSERLNELYYSARDLATDLADRLDAYGFDAGELDQIESRLDTIYRIKQKFGMEVEELLARRDAAAAELESFQSSGQRIAELKARMQTLYAAAKEAARQSLLSEYDGVQLTEAVRLRSAADNDTATSLTIDSGKVARLNDYQDGWYQVTFGQSTGYIPAEYAQPVHYADYEGTSATNTVREELIAYAYTYLGTPYVYGGSSYSGTDCSGFTMAVFAKFGYSLSHGASDQYYTATSVSSEERQAGDLVFFDTFGGISHVGIYLGGGQFIHASSSGGVKVNSLYESYYAACYLGAGRILP